MLYLVLFSLLFFVPSSPKPSYESSSHLFFDLRSFLSVTHFPYLTYLILWRNEQSFSRYIFIFSLLAKEMRVPGLDLIFLFICQSPGSYSVAKGKS